MKAQDWQDPDSARNLAVSQLAEICSQAGLSWSATEKQFIIELPDVVLSRVVPTVPQRKTFDISTWGPKGIDEANPLPDDFQMPDYGELLDEGEPPKGDQDAEK